MSIEETINGLSPFSVVLKVCGLDHTRAAAVITEASIRRVTGAQVRRVCQSGGSPPEQWIVALRQYFLSALSDACGFCEHQTGKENWFGPEDSEAMGQFASSFHLTTSDDVGEPRLAAAIYMLISPKPSQVFVTVREPDFFTTGWQPL